MRGMIDFHVARSLASLHHVLDLIVDHDVHNHRHLYRDEAIMPA